MKGKSEAPKISKEGIRLLKSFEGFHKRLKNGSCAAYQTYLGKDRLGRARYDIPTIGYGCTEGIQMGMVWTEAEAEAALRKELARFESAVVDLVKVPINQNERDALISLSYNIGIGNFSKSTLLRKLNKGDRTGAAREFSRWNKAQGIVLPGLVSRRTREAALFLKPAEKPSEPYMPQCVEPDAEPVSKTAVGVTVATASTVVPLIGPAMVPDVPPAVVDAVGKAETWTELGGRLWTLKGWAVTQPLLALLLLSACAALWLWPRRAP